MIHIHRFIYFTLGTIGFVLMLLPLMFALPGFALFLLAVKYLKVVGLRHGKNGVWPV